MSLTPQQVQLFRHNGFIKLPTHLSEERVAALKALALKHIREEIEPVVRQNGHVIRISDLWGRGGIFQEVITCDEILDPLESLLGENIEFLLNRHNHVYLRDKASSHSLGFHRDVIQWTRTIVTVIVYLEDTNLDNGCTRLVPGSHTFPGFSTNRVSHVDALKETGIFEQAVPIPMPAGGMIAIDSTIIHSAGINHTDGTRMSMTLGYHSVDELAGYDNPKRVLVRGQRFYRGNDTY